MSYKILCSTVRDGNMSIKYDKNNTAIKNREKFLMKNNIKENKTLFLKIKYSDIIVDLIDNKEIYSCDSVDGDCIITNDNNLFLYLFFGDCIPLVIYDNKNNILSFAHMGWQSIELNLHLKIIKYLQKNYNSEVENLEVILGPSIKKESYILKNPSQLKYAEWNDYLNNIGDNFYEIDLNSYLYDGLKSCGIENIQNSNIDTAKNNNYFSHYRSIYINKDENEGRFLFGVMLNDDFK